MNCFSLRPFMILGHIADSINQLIRNSATRPVQDGTVQLLFFSWNCMEMENTYWQTPLKTNKIHFQVDLIIFLHTGPSRSGKKLKLHSKALPKNSFHLIYGRNIHLKSIFLLMITECWLTGASSPGPMRAAHILRYPAGFNWLSSGSVSSNHLLLNEWRCSSYMIPTSHYITTNQVICQLKGRRMWAEL